MSTSVKDLASEVKKCMDEYMDLTNAEMKEAVKKTADDVKKQIESNAPKDTGTYSRSWAVKKTKENSNSIEMTVHSKNKYQLTHLLEFGHASRNGGRVEGQPHIEPAEHVSGDILESEIRKRLEKIK